MNKKTICGVIVLILAICIVGFNNLNQQSVVVKDITIEPGYILGDCTYMGYNQKSNIIIFRQTSLTGTRIYHFDYEEGMSITMFVHPVIRMKNVRINSETQHLTYLVREVC